MIRKISILSLVLMPFLLCGNDLFVRLEQSIKTKEARIKELENAKCRTLQSISQLASRIREDGKKLDYHKSEIFSELFHKTADKENVTQEKFDTFLLHLCSAFDKGEDITPLIEKESFYRKEYAGILHFIYTSLVVERLLINGMVNQYRDQVEELRKMNKELHTLKA